MMKKLLSILLALSLLAACAAALAEAAPGAEDGAALELTFGYLAPTAQEETYGALCREAFAYAAERKGVDTVLMAYDPEDVPPEAAATSAPEASATEGAAEEAVESPAARALKAMLEGEPDGVVIVAESVEQAKELAELAAGAKVPVVIDGVDMRSAYLPPEQPEDPDSLPYVAAVRYSDAASYAAAMWLDEHADSPLTLHSALPGADPAIREGLARALEDGQYLELVDEIEADSDSASAGRSAVNLMFNSYTMFGCVLADSAELGEGCAAGLRSAGESMPVAAVARSAEDLESLDEGVDMLAFAPAAVEGVACFQALYGFATEQILPESEGRMVHPAAVTVTKGNRKGWIEPDGCEAAYALAYPEDALPGAEAAGEAAQSDAAEDAPAAK